MNMLFIPVRIANIYPRILSICSLFTLAAAEADFNPLAIADEYVYLKHGSYSSGPFSGWRCESTVYRKRLYPIPPASGTRIAFQDSNAVQCTLFAITSQGLRDSSVLESHYLETLSFWESNDSLFASGLNRFLNVFVPADLHSSNPMGLSGNLSFGQDSTTAFPKRAFPTHLPLPNWSPDCKYLEQDRITPCKRMLVSDYRYRSETFVFLADQGFLSLDFSWSGAPLGIAPSGATQIQLLRMRRGVDTLNYNGSLQTTQVNIRSNAKSHPSRVMPVSSLVDALGRDRRAQKSWNTKPKLFP